MPIINVNIGDYVSVGNYAFSECSSLQKLIIGDYVTIGNYAFSNCTAIKRILIGDNVTKGVNAFENVVIKGTCGENLTWALVIENEELFIDGTGAMTDYSLETESPWHDYIFTINTIIVGGNVTSIGNYAFKDCDNAIGIYLNEGVKNIGEYSFYSCDNLEYIEIPKSIQKIGKNVYGECKKLTEIIFCGDAPALDSETFLSLDKATIYYPETGTGWTDRLLNKFDNLTWSKWDNTTPSKDVVLVLDTSASMSGRMDQLKDSAITFVKGVGGRRSNTRISVVEYNTNAREISGFSTNSNMHIGKINKLESTGGTCYLEALECANGIIKKSKADFKAIVLFSDGEPNDPISEISSFAAQLRKNYKIYTVGLLSNENQRQVLVNVAGSEENYFEATNIEGLLQAFLNLMDDFGKEENTTVEIKRNNDRYNLLTEKQEICENSPEKVSIIVTPGNKHIKEHEIGSIALVQNGNVILENDTGIFESIEPGKLFEKNKIIYAVLSDSKGNEIESLELKLIICKNFTITYRLNYGNNDVYMTQAVINGMDIQQPPDPIRPRYKFLGWYTSQACDGISFFNHLNDFNRLNINSDITLYAKWDIESNRLALPTDAYSFTNTSDVFKGMFVFKNVFYEITSGDYAKLTQNLTNAEKEKIREFKNTEWSGSCFGMSSSVCLMYDNTFDISDFDSNYLYPGEMKNLVHNTKGDNDVSAVESMINYYQLRALTSNIRFTMWGDYSKEDESYNIEKIINKLRIQKNPVVLVIYLCKTDNVSKEISSGKAGSHAVVAYDLKENVDENTYTFEVYDCSFGNKRSYTVTATKNGKSYDVECEDWEKACWNYKHIFLASSLTLDELKKDPILTKPGVIEVNSVNSNVANIKYELETSYPSFRITNGTQYAVVKNCSVVEGDLMIECIGPTNFIGQSPNYLFRLPLLDEKETYTITPESDISYKTSITYNDKTSGFRLSEESDKAGTIVVSGAGKISAKYSEKANFKVKVVTNSSKNLWYSTSMSGADTGFSAEVDSNKSKFSTANAVTTNIELNTRFDSVSINDVKIDSTGLELTSDKANVCVVKKNGTEVLRKNFGYSVVFDSQLGTVIDTITNVSEDSLIEEPNDPKRAGYIFEGWFKEQTCENLWDFDNDKITSDTILYAGWSLDANYFVNVRFEIPGMETQSIYLPKGSKINSDKCPKIPNDLDKSWYISNDYVDVWELKMILL